MAIRRGRYFCGLDIGTTKICCVIGRENDHGVLTVEGVGIVPTRVQDYPGEIMAAAQPRDIELVANRIAEAVTSAERMAGPRVRIREVCVGIAGQDVVGQNVEATIKVANPDTGVSERDLEKVLALVHKSVVLKDDQAILQLIPHSYTLDDNPGIHKPLGLSCYTLTLHAHAVTARRTNANNIFNSITRAGYTPILMVAQGIASAESILTEPERRLGTLLIDLGGGTTDFAAYRGGSVIASGSISRGGEEITTALARHFHIEPDVADDIKVRFGRAVLDGSTASETFNVRLLATGEQVTHRRDEIASTAYEKLSRIFHAVGVQFESTGYVMDHISSGIKLTGGGSLMPGIEDLSNRIFGLPSAIARPLPMPGFTSGVASPIYSTACGLLILAHKANRPSATDAVTNYTFGQKVQNFIRKLGKFYTGE